jgi:hypothetical protein
MEKRIVEKQQQLIGLTDAFCKEILHDEEYAKLAEKLILKMGRKKNVPFESGQIEIWAAAVIHALGSINFLFDKSQNPHSTVEEINNFFGTKKTTTTGKSKFIRDLFKLEYWDEEFSTNRTKNDNPLADLTMVNGFIVPKKYIQDV